MWRLLALFAVLGFAQCTCPEHFDLVKDGECRGLGGRDTSYFADSASRAIEICAGYQGKPMIIHDEEHQMYWRYRAAPLSDGYTILGLVCNQNSKKWEWADGSIVDYRPEQGYYNPELNKDCSPGSSWYFNTNGTWSLGSTKDIIKTVNFCTTQLEQPTPEDAGCDEEDDVCFPIVLDGENWQDAESTCKRFDAHLASIHNKQENSYIRRQAVAEGAVNGVFIGAKADKDGKFQWIDGTTMDYENYAPGFPKKNFGDCIAMDTSSTSGQWMNVDCNTKLSVACAVNQDAETTCTGEDYKEGAIMTSPGYPFSASTPCDYFISAPAGKGIALEILTLESNGCCDFVVIHDAFLGGHQIGNVSGISVNQTFTSTSNLMRVSWLPDGGVNVRGLMMTYKLV